MSKFSWVGNFFLVEGGRRWVGRLKLVNPAGCHDPVEIYIAIVLHNFAFLPKISLLNSHKSILPLQNLCRNIFDLCQSFVVLLTFVGTGIDSQVNVSWNDNLSFQWIYCVKK